jgi:hypothetical protein
MAYSGSVETCWNVVDGDTPISSLYLCFTPHRYQYDTSRRSAAIAYALELREYAANVRLYRSKTVRTFDGPGMIRQHSVITHTEVSF